MWTAIILACGIANGVVTDECKAFTGNYTLPTRKLCEQSVANGYILIQSSGWEPMAYKCINWMDVEV